MFIVPEHYLIYKYDVNQTIFKCSANTFVVLGSTVRKYDATLSESLPLER